MLIKLKEADILTNVSVLIDFILFIIILIDTVFTFPNRISKISVLLIILFSLICSFAGKCRNKTILSSFVFMSNIFLFLGSLVIFKSIFAIIRLFMNYIA